MRENGAGMSISGEAMDETVADDQGKTISILLVGTLARAKGVDLRIRARFQEQAPTEIDFHGTRTSELVSWRERVSMYH